MTKVRISRDAAEELNEAVQWYEHESSGLGGKLLDAFEHAVGLMQGEMPPLLPVDGNARKLGAKRIILRRFPYSLIVIQRLGEYIVVALAHHSRKPGYWHERIRT